MSKLHVFYRLSDKGENKEKLEEINNIFCLENFLKEFPASEITIIADNVEEDTMEWLGKYNFNNIYQTRLGNSKSFWFAYKMALSLDKTDFVYFVENDYLHRPGSRTALKDGMEIADYVTLYDHPDKYMDGINPKVKRGGEVSKVFLTSTSHWKITNSTTMTFASKVSTLKKDSFFFKFFTIGIINSNFPYLKKLQTRRFPADYRIFSLLKLLKRRKLICPIPGFSTHGETNFLSPLINWSDFF
jgi:hypothetical protein